MKIVFDTLESAINPLESGEVKLADIDLGAMIDISPIMHGDDSEAIEQVLKLRKADVVGEIRRSDAVLVLVQLYANVHNTEYYTEDELMLADDYIKYIYEEGYGVIDSSLDLPGVKGDLADIMKKANGMIYVNDLDKDGYIKVFGKTQLLYIKESEIKDFDFDDITQEGDILYTELYGYRHDIMDTCAENYNDFIVEHLG